VRALVSLCVIGALASACASGVTPSAGPPTGTRPIAPSAPAVASATAPATPATSALTTGTVTVQMGDHFYDPARLVVARGTTVVWKNVGITVHDVTSYGPRQHVQLHVRAARPVSLLLHPARG